MKNDPGGKQGQGPVIQASGVSNTTNYIALPGQSYCELNPGSCVGDDTGFWLTMGGAAVIAAIPPLIFAAPAIAAGGSALIGLASRVASNPKVQTGMKVMDTVQCLSGDPTACAGGVPGSHVPVIEDDFTRFYRFEAYEREGLEPSEIIQQIKSSAKGWPDIFQTVSNAPDLQTVRQIMTDSGVETVVFPDKITMYARLKEKFGPLAVTGGGKGIYIASEGQPPIIGLTQNADLEDYMHEFSHFVFDTEFGAFEYSYYINEWGSSLVRKAVESLNP